MRILVTVCLAAAAFLWAAPAQAQYANRHFGVSGGYLSVSSEMPFEWTVPLALEAGAYIQDGWEWYAHLPIMVVRDKLSSDADPRNMFAAGVNLGLRYLFSEDLVRPYIGGELAGLYLFANQYGSPVYGGPGAVLGLEVFVTESVSIGARLRGDLFLNLDTAPIFGGAGMVNVAASF